MHARARVSVVRVCAAVRARDAPRATLVLVVAVACAHLRAARSQCPCVRTFSVCDVGDSHTQSSGRGTKHPLP